MEMCQQRSEVSLYLYHKVVDLSRILTSFGCTGHVDLAYLHAIRYSWRSLGPQSNPPRRCPIEG